MLVALFGIFTFVTFLTRWTQVAFSNVVPGAFEFDGALRLLSHYYTRLGLVPYVDFGVVYPPGLFLLIGKLIPFVSIEQRNFILAILLLFITAVLVILLSVLQAKKKVILPLALFLIINTVRLDEIVWSEPFSRLFLTMLFLVLPLYLKSGKRTLLFLAFVCSLLTVFFRWSHVGLFIAMQGLILVIVALITYFKNKTVSPVIKKLFTLVISETCGMLVGLVLLFVYLYAHQALSQGVDFIFSIPTYVIHDYRVLPLPIPVSIFDENALFYTTLAVCMVQVFLGVRWLWRERTDTKALMVVCFSLLPLFVLPYAINRMDSVHTRTFFYYVGLGVILFYTITARTKALLVLMSVLLLPLAAYLLPVRPSLPNAGSLVSRDLSRQLQECKNNVSEMNYVSLFVGRLSYNQAFVINTAALYLINPNVRPATAFISDEPGVQNSVKYGEMIADQLHRAPKPMLAFLEIWPQFAEPNATRHIQSAGKIEEALNQTPFKAIGVCMAYGKYFAIRLYD